MPTRRPVVRSSRRVAIAALVVVAALVVAQEVEKKKTWEIHDLDRPRPGVVVPATASTQAEPGRAPSDAVVLFDGSSLEAWSNDTWVVESGAMRPGQGDNRTQHGFGDCQLHVEWATPATPAGEDQGRGNSGVYLMGLYEVQVLDSFENVTYADGQASAIYGQNPPLVNACRKPGEWQTYDIVFHRPRFDAEGGLVTPATVTVLHNGVLTQDHFALTGPTGHHAQPPYKAHADKLPIQLQDHGSPVRYRNLWVRPLE